MEYSPVTEQTSDNFKLLCWQGYDDASVIEPFCQVQGVTPHTQSLLSDAQTASDLAQGVERYVDVLNINNAYVRDYLHPRGLIKSLDKSRFEPHLEHWLPQFSRLYPWAYSNDNALIGICQRFGAFNLVVNTHRIDVKTAQDQGFQLANDPGLTQKFGILAYDDFNIFHICLGTNINPFIALTPAQIDAYALTAQSWHRRALLVTDDHHQLNQALLDGEIDFYISGGVYTVSPARMQGHLHLHAVTPDSGPINGQGGIVFAEVTSCINHDRASAVASDFLEYVLQPETAIRIATMQGTCNPIVQMGDPAVFAKFDRRYLDAIQWQTLEEDISRCADYQLVPDHAVLLEHLHLARQARST